MNLQAFQTTPSGGSTTAHNWRSKSNNSRVSNQLPPAPPFPLQYQNYHQNTNTGYNNNITNANRYNSGNYTNTSSNRNQQQFYNRNKSYEHKNRVKNDCANTNESLSVNIQSYALIDTMLPHQQHSSSFYTNKTADYQNDAENNKTNLGCSDGASADNSSSVVSTPTPDAISPKTTNTNNSIEDNSLRSSTSSCSSSTHQTPPQSSSSSSHDQLNTSPLLTNTNKVENLQNTNMLTVDTQSELNVDLSQKELVNRKLVIKHNRGWEF